MKVGEKKEFDCPLCGKKHEFLLESMNSTSMAITATAHCDTLNRKVQRRVSLTA